MNNYSTAKNSFGQMTYSIESNTKSSGQNYYYTCPDKYRKELKYSFNDSINNSNMKHNSETNGFSNDDLDLKILQLKKENEQLIKEMSEYRINQPIIQRKNEYETSSYLYPKFNDSNNQNHTFNTDNKVDSIEHKIKSSKYQKQNCEIVQESNNNFPINIRNSNYSDEVINTSFDFFNFLANKFNEPSFNISTLKQNPKELQKKLVFLQNKIIQKLKQIEVSPEEKILPRNNNYYPSFGNEKEQLSKSFDGDSKYKNCPACVLNCNNSSKGYIPYKMFSKTHKLKLRSRTPDTQSLKHRRYITKLFKQKNVM